MKLKIWIILFTSFACGVISDPQNLVVSANVEKPQAVKMVVVADTLNIRIGAGVDYPASKRGLRRGDVVTCWQIEDNWCLHELGWSNMLYMEVK